MNWARGLTKDRSWVATTDPNRVWPVGVPQRCTYSLLESVTIDVLREVFPSRRLRYKNQPYTALPTQTYLGHSEPRIGETDVILS